MKRLIHIHTIVGAEIVVKEEIQCDVTKIKGAEAAYKLMDKIFRFKELEREYSYIIVLDEKYYPSSIMVSPPGERDSVAVDSLGMAYYTCAVGAKYIINAHNHPSGDPTPSAEDVDCFVEFYNIFGGQLLDYIVCGSEAIAPTFAQEYYFSFQEKRYFDHLRNSRQLHNIYTHHLEQVTVSLSENIDDLWGETWNQWDENNKIWKEIEKMKNSIKKLEITANSGKTQSP